MFLCGKIPCTGFLMPQFLFIWMQGWPWLLEAFPTASCNRHSILPFSVLNNGLISFYSLSFKLKQHIYDEDNARRLCIQYKCNYLSLNDVCIEWQFEKHQPTKARVSLFELKYAFKRISHTITIRHLKASCSVYSFLLIVVGLDTHIQMWFTVCICTYIS